MEVRDLMLTTEDDRVPGVALDLITETLLASRDACQRSRIVSNLLHDLLAIVAWAPGRSPDDEDWQRVAHTEVSSLAAVTAEALAHQQRMHDRRDALARSSEATRQDSAAGGAFAARAAAEQPTRRSRHDEANYAHEPRPDGRGDGELPSNGPAS